MSYFTELQTQMKSASHNWLRFPLHISQRRMLLLGVDLALLITSLVVGLHLNRDTPLSYATLPRYSVWCSMLVLLWIAIAMARHNYSVKRAAHVLPSTLGVIKLLLITSVIYTLLLLLFPSVLTKWSSILFVWGLAASLLVLWRVVYAKVLVQPNFQRRVLIVGAGWAEKVITSVIEEENLSYEIIGYISGGKPEQDQSIRGISVLSSRDNLSAFVQQNGVSDIVLAVQRPMDADLERAVLKCFEQGVRIVSMPKLFEEITGRIPVEQIGDSWLVFLPTDRDRTGLYPIVKRAMDIAIAGIGFLGWSPIFLIMALAIKLDSPGPIFYRPERLGQGGKPFRLWKFRTMVSNADRIGDPTFTKKNDTRITRVGRLLRLSHIDELPQFINILAGEMSLVGPRPERYLPELEEHIPFYRTRYAVKPGATGLALVQQGYAEGIEGTLLKLQYDLYYIKYQSLSLDTFILFKSVIHMLTMGGQ